MSELNPKHVEAVMTMINQGYYFKHLSMFVKDIGMGYSLVEVDIGDEHLNPFGGLHGGVYASGQSTPLLIGQYMVNLKKMQGTSPLI